MIVLRNWDVVSMRQAKVLAVELKEAHAALILNAAKDSAVLKECAVMVRAIRPANLVWQNLTLRMKTVRARHSRAVKPT